MSTTPNHLFSAAAGATVMKRAVALLVAAIMLALVPGVASAAEPEGFLATSGPVPANATGLLWRSDREELKSADIEVAVPENGDFREVPVVRIPRDPNRGVVRPTTGWSPGDRYRFIYRRPGVTQKIDVEVVETELDLTRAADIVTVRKSKPFVRRGDGCISHCPAWDTPAGGSGVLVSVDLAAWAPFRPLLEIGVADANGEVWNDGRMNTDGRFFLHRPCGADDDSRERFWLWVRFPAADEPRTGVLGPIDVPDVCETGPEPSQWPPLEQDAVTTGERPPTGPFAANSRPSTSTEEEAATAPDTVETGDTAPDEHETPAEDGVSDHGVASAEGEASGQADRRRWTVQVDPLTTLLGFVHLQVERSFGGYASLYLGPSLRLFSPPWDLEPFVGYGAEAGVRVYPFGTAPHGWWLMGRGVLAHLRTNVNGSTETAVGGYGSALGGYTWVLDWGLVLSLGLGVQVLDYTIADLGPRGVLPAAHTAVGFAF